MSDMLGGVLIVAACVLGFVLIIFATTNGGPFGSHQTSYSEIKYSCESWNPASPCIWPIKP